MRIERIEAGVPVTSDENPLTLSRAFDVALGKLKAELAFREADPDWSTIEVETDTSVIETQTFNSVVSDRYFHKSLYLSVMAAMQDEA